jgi:hypothetical protein
MTIIILLFDILEIDWKVKVIVHGLVLELLF